VYGIIIIIIIIIMILHRNYSNKIKEAMKTAEASILQLALLSQGKGPHFQIYMKQFTEHCLF
jgi:hypothetical protein